MSIRHPYVNLIVLAIIALILSALPLPKMLIYANPFWMLLLYIYWLIYSPTKGRLLFALILGTLVDVISADVLGQHALALILSSAFFINVRHLFFISNIITQQIYILATAIIYLAVILIVHILVHGLDFNWLILLAPVLTTLMWPVVKIIFTSRKKKYGR